MRTRHLRRPSARLRAWFRPQLLRLEDRVVPNVSAVTLTDPSFWGDTGFGLSAKPSISADGQRIVFESDAANLVANDTNGWADVFLYDRGTGRTSLVSVNAAGTVSGTNALGGGSSSRDARISADGRFVIFRSPNTDLVSPAPGTIGNVNNIFIRDLTAGTTRLVSISADGLGGAGADCDYATVSADGRYVTFQTASNRIVPNDTNNNIDVFRRDLQTNTTQLVSVSATGGVGDGHSFEPQMTPGGRFILFKSTAGNLATFDRNNVSDALFVRDMQAGTTRIVTVDPTGVFNANAHTSFSDQAISDDGRYIVFWNNATNLVPQNTPSFQNNVYIRDMQANTNRLVSINRAGNAGSNGFNATITPNGQFAAFIGNANDIASDVVETNGRLDVYQTAVTPTTLTTRLVSVNSAGTNGGDNDSGTGVYPNIFTAGFPRMSADGRYVAFEGLATNLVAGVTDANSDRDTFVRDMQTNTTRLASVTSGGTASGAARSTTPVISADGSVLAFESLAANFVLNDDNGNQDLFVRDLAAGVTEAASRRGPLVPRELLAGDENPLLDATPDGRYVLYRTRNNSLVAPQFPANGSYNMYLRDRTTGALEAISVQPGGALLSDRHINSAILSADARFVAFSTAATNMAAGVTAPQGGIYLRDRVTGVTTYISRNPTTGAVADSGINFVSAVSPDGRYVAFISQSTNLISGVPASGWQLYLYDRVAVSLRLVTTNAAGAAAGNGGGGDFQPSFSGDGRTLVFVHLAGDLVAGVTDANDNSAFDVYAYDTATGTKSVVSVNTTGNTTGNSTSGGLSRGPRISADGRFVVFVSAATNLVAGASNGPFQVYIRDLVTGTTQLISINQTNNGQANGENASPSISADGRYVLFNSAASNLAPLANGRFQLYLRDRQTNTTELVTLSASGTAAGDPNSGDPGQLYGRGGQLSADGRSVVFLSDARNLVADFVSGNNNNTSLFFRDLDRDVTLLVKENVSGTASGNRGETVPYLLASAGLSPSVIFESHSSDLVAYDRNTAPDIFAFTYAGAASIAGTLFRDADGNGTQGASETGFAFGTVYLDANGNGRFDSDERYVKTDLSGKFKFTNLPAGTYTVAVAIEDGLVRTTAASRTFTLATATSAATGADFGVRTAPVDLVTDKVTAPATAQPGEVVPVSWLVRNVGANAAPGAWQDAVYLSADPELDAGDQLVALVPHTGGLGASRSYTGTANVAMPAILPGQFFVIVDTDRRHQIAGETNRANNLFASLTPTDLTIPALLVGPGTPNFGQFGPAHPDFYYRFTSAQGDTVTLTLQSAAFSGTTELYVARNRLPNTGDFDLSARANTPNQTLTIPSVLPGTYYVLARGGNGAAATANFGITASVVGFGLTSVGPSTGTNAGRVTVDLRGTRLTPNTQVSLVAGATTIPASAVFFQDSTQVFATFDLTGRPVGAYDVKATNGTATATLAGAFTVQAAQQATDALQLFLTLPKAVRVGRTSKVVVEYLNAGATDLVAPLLRLTSANANIRLPGQPEYTADLTFLGISPDGPAGVLRPGQRGQVEIEFQATGGLGQSADFQLFSTDPALVMDWAAIKPTFRPGNIPTDAWDAVFANFLADVGTTVGDYQAMLAGTATYLSGIGIYTPNVIRLLNLELHAAEGADAGGSLATVVDADLPASGFNIQFVRSQLQSIQGRYTVGPFGRGWTDNWDIQAMTLTGGGVVVRTGGSRRFFYVQPNGSYTADGGDTGTLTLSGSTYTLTERDGSVSKFRPDGRLDFIADPHNNRVTAGYDGSGRLVSLTHSSGATITLTYNAQGFVSGLTDSAGHTVAYAYTGDHLTGYTDRFGSHTYTYATGQGAAREHALASVNYSDDTHFAFAYDARGRLVAEQQDTGRVLTYTYLPGGYTVTDAGGGTNTRLLDDHGQLVREIDALGHVLNYTYDGNRNLTHVTLPDGTIARYAYDALGNVTAATDPGGNQTNYTYDDKGNLTSFTDALGRATRYTYSATDDLLRIDYPDGTNRRATYDAVGNPTSVTDGRGIAIQYQTNAAGQVAKKTYADGTSVTYTYDSRGRLATATDGSGTTTLAYNNLDVLTKVTYPNGRFLQFQYNVVGQRTQSVDQDGFTTNYVRDVFGRLERLTDATGALIVKYTYDATNRLVREDKGNGTATTYAYDSASELLTLTNLAPGGAVNSKLDYTYDAHHRRVTMTLTDADPSTPDGTTTYGYDAVDQLTSVALPGGRTITYRYDAVGNRVSVTDGGVTTAYTVNAANEYTRVGDTSYTYDANGNLTSKTDAAGTTAYAYDAESRLVGVNGSGTAATYTYDALGHRSAATVNGQTTNYLIDPIGLWSVAAEYTGAGSAIAHFTNGYGLASRVAAGGATAYYDFDGSGNTVGLTGASGQYVNRYTYLPFGATTTVAAGVANAFTFGGYFGVAATAGGLLDMRARSYDPATGQFLSNDLLGLGGGDVNFRRFVGNNPVNSVDPFGLQSVSLPVPPQNERLSDFYKDQGCGATPKPKPKPTPTPTPTNPPAYLYAPYQGYSPSPSGYPYIGDYDVHYFNAPGGRPGNAGGGGGDGGCPCPCPPGGNPGGPNKPGDQGETGIVGPVDPNDITGPAGFGAAQFVSTTQALPYRIRFENTATSTAPAQEVFVTHPLDADLDLTTFQLTSFGFGPIAVDVPAGRQNYKTSVDFQNPDGTPLRVDLSVALDAAAGVVLWTFRSLDPLTGLFPEDPFAGFLPPNDASHRGDGFVNYTVRAKAGLATGTTIDQQASIVFDVNEPIATNLFTNTIDASPPTSSVLALPAVTTTASIPVLWSGSDNDQSGVATYDVFVSDNGSPFTAWLIGTPETSGDYDAQNGHTYAFFTVATDNVGNRQVTPIGGQASTVVNALPPRVESVTINNGSAQRSTVRSLTVTFNTTVTATAGAFTLQVIDGANIAVTPIASIVNGRTAMVLTFSGAGVTGGSLNDGRYSLTVNAALVHDHLGNALDGNGDSTAGDAYTLADDHQPGGLYRLFGDATGDRVVNGADLTPFIPLFGSQDSTFDFNGDGVFNGADIAAFVANFGKGIS